MLYLFFPLNFRIKNIKNNKFRIKNKNNNEISVLIYFFLSLHIPNFISLPILVSYYYYY